jgi:hypothetical protein
MNLLLLISMLQVWILASEDHSAVVEGTRKLGDDMLQMQMYGTAIKTAQAFVSEYENSRIGDSSWNVQKIRLSTILAISTYDFDSSFPDPETIRRNALNGPPGTEAQVSKFVAAVHEDATTILEGLRATIEHAHLPPETSTIYDLEKVSAKEIDMPFVHAGVEPHIAFQLLAIGSLLVIAMLYSLFDSIWRVGTETKKWGGPVLDAALLHPSKWAPNLAGIWIGAPSLLVAAGTFGPLKVAVNSRESWVLGVIAFIIGVIAVKILIRGKTIRARRRERWPDTRRPLTEKVRGP